MSASRQKLEQELQLKQQAIETMSKDVIHTNDLEEEFTCTICQELILCAMTLECSHSFCNGCITGWLDKKKVGRITAFIFLFAHKIAVFFLAMPDLPRVD